MSKRKKENNIERKAEDIVEVRPKEKQDAEMPPDSAALLNYDVLFSDLNDLSKLKKEHADFVSAKLNDHLQTQVLNSVGTVSDSMEKALQQAVMHLDYQKLKDSQLSDVINSILKE